MGCSENKSDDERYNRTRANQRSQVPDPINIIKKMKKNLIMMKNNSKILKKSEVNQKTIKKTIIII